MILLSASILMSSIVYVSIMLFYGNLLFVLLKHGSILNLMEPILSLSLSTYVQQGFDLNGGGYSHPKHIFENTCVESLGPTKCSTSIKFSKYFQ